MFQWLRRMLRDPAGENPADWHAPPVGWYDPPAEPYARFTDRARKVMELASGEARRFNHEYIGTEHILLGLVQVGEGVALAVLKKCDVSVAAVRRSVERIIQHGPGGEPVYLGQLPHTPRTTMALRWACEEARFLAHDFVCTEHLLMGLLHESEGVAAQVLNIFGLTVDRARDEVIRLSPPGRGSHSSAATP